MRAIRYAKCSFDLCPIPAPCPAVLVIAYYFEQVLSPNGHLRLMKHAVLFYRKHVHQCVFVAVVVHPESVLQIHRVLISFVGSQRHQYLVFYATRKVGGKGSALFCRIAFHALYQPDRTNGNEVVQVVFAVFFCYVRHQSHVVSYQLVARGSAPRLHARKTFHLFLWRQWLRITSVAKISRQKEQPFDKFKKRRKHNFSPTILYAPTAVNICGACAFLLVKTIQIMYDN